MDNQTIKTLIEQALIAQQKAYVPYSGFYVGAALLCDLGIVTGCNIENAAYGPTNCAERTAFFKAVSEGCRNFTAIAIVGGKPDVTPELCYPCGVCRQVMMEFVDADTFTVIIAKSADEYRVHTLAELLPYGFGPKDLGM